MLFHGKQGGTVRRVKDRLSPFVETSLTGECSIVAMSRKSRVSQMNRIVSSLLAGIASGDEEKTDISCLGELFASMSVHSSLIF